MAHATQVVHAAPVAHAMPVARGPFVPPVNQDEEDVDTLRDVLGFLPSWLVSLVVHLCLVLLLALLTVVGNGNGGVGIFLDASGGPGGTGDEMLLAAGVEMPSELTAGETLDNSLPDVSELASHSLIPDLDIANPLGGAASGGVDGVPDGTESGPRGSPLGNALEGAGSPVSTGIFGLRSEGTDFVYVFDRSDSMNSVFSYASEGRTVFSITPLDAAKIELNKSLDDLQAANRFHIVFYNHDTWLFDTGKNPQKDPVLATPEMKRRASQFIASVYGHGRTKHVPPLETALKMKPDVIFLLTDGEAKDDPTPAELGRLRRLNGGRTKINVVQFCYEPRAGGALAQLAEETGGRHIFFNISKLAPNINDLSGDNGK